MNENRKKTAAEIFDAAASKCSVPGEHAPGVAVPCRYHLVEEIETALKAAEETLRDRFATAALSGLAALRFTDGLARMAYETADAMIAERDKKSTP